MVLGPVPVTSTCLPAFSAGTDIICVRDSRAGGVHENQVDFSPTDPFLCPFGSLRPRLMNDYSMSNYKQGVLFTRRSVAANENGSRFQRDSHSGDTRDPPSDGNHEPRTKPVSTMRIHLRVCSSFSSSSSLSFSSATSQ